MLALAALAAMVAARGDLRAAASPQTPPGLAFVRDVERGDAARRGGDFVEAASAYRQALEISEVDPHVFVSLGHALFASKNYKEAAAAYERGWKKGFYDRALGAHQIAVCEALAGDDEATLSWLEETIRSRWKDRQEIARDARFARLKANPRFQKVIGSLPDTVGDRVSGWRYDLDFLASEIVRLDPAYATGLPEPFRARIESLRSRLATLTDTEISLETMALFASLRRMHTVMVPFGMRHGVLSGLVPVQLWQFKDGLFVINAPDAQADLIGSQVLSIGGKDVASLSRAAARYISRDSDSFLPFAVPISLMWIDLLKAIGGEVGPDFVEFRVRRAGRDRTARVPFAPGPIDPDAIPMRLIAPKAPAPAPKYLANLKRNLSLEKLDESTLYVQLNQMVDDRDKTLEQFARELTAHVKTGKIRDVIVDVRLNNGGNYEATLPVIDALLSFETTVPRARLFVIEGRNTVSAAQNFISALDELGHPIFVGEPSGSRPDHVGDDTTVVLPYSGIISSVACAVHQTSFRDEREWIAPNIPVELSSEEYFRNADPALDAILALIRDRGNVD